MGDPREVDETQLRYLLGPRYPSVSVIAETGSTNADLVAAAADGAQPGTVLIAGHQTAGRGRLDRSWTAPPWASVATSVLLALPSTRPDNADGEGAAWLPVLVGLAVAHGIEQATQLSPRIKWPNDVLIDGRKVCGILGQRAELPGPPRQEGMVLGFGLNTMMTAAELPVPTATSLLIELERPERRPTDRALAVTEDASGGPQLNPTLVLASVLRNLASRLAPGPQDAFGVDVAGVRAEYLQRCETIGRQVRVDLGAEEFTGRAVDVDATGRLIVAGANHTRTFAAGDVTHLRAADN